MEEKLRLIKLWESGMSYRDIAIILNKEYNTDYWDYERVRNRIRKYRKQQEIKKVNNIQVPEIHKIPNIDSQNKKIMVMCDIHYPYHREDVLENIKKHAHEISALVIGGDAINNDSLSKFLEISKLTFEEEIIGFYGFVKQIRNVLPSNVKIIFIRGNHEYRLYKYIASLHEKQLAKFINPEVIQMLVDGFTIYEGVKKIEFKPIENIEYIPHWFVNINNELIVCHPDEFSRIRGRTALNAIKYFTERGEQFSMVLVAHTHLYDETKDFGKFGVQMGCCCKPQGYADKGSFKYQPQDYNYAIIQFDKNGKVDINATRIYHLPELYPITEQDINYKIKI